MSLLRFSDILTRARVDAKKTLLIRHTLSHRIIKACYEQDKKNGNDIMMMTVTQEQDYGFSDGSLCWRRYAISSLNGARFPLYLYGVSDSPVLLH